MKNPGKELGLMFLSSRTLAYLAAIVAALFCMSLALVFTRLTLPLILLLAANPGRWVFLPPAAVLLLILSGILRRRKTRRANVQR
jgi:cytochrome c biogenesis protein CcdA